MRTDTPKPSELPPEEKWAMLKRYIAEAEKYEHWRIRAQHRLLSDFAPRIARLGKSGYMGCGFHYDLEQRLGKLVVSLSTPWQPCMNWIDNCPQESTKAIIQQVVVNSLAKQITEAEASAKTIAR